MKSLDKEIERVKTLPFIKDIKLNENNLVITFKLPVIRFNHFTRYDHGKDYGVRYVYLGKQTLTIYYFPYLGITMTGEIRHPHNSGEHSLCVGNEQTINMLRNWIKNYKIYEVINFIWLWLHIYTNNGYRKQAKVYDEALTKGFPVWDEKKVRININDKERIESGEQYKLKKLKCYDKNIKRFKDVII